MNIYTYLKKDHRVVNSLFLSIIDAKTVRQRLAFFNELKTELIIHAESEHSTFYSALKKTAEGKSYAKHGDKEHNKIELMIEKIENTDPKASLWLVQLGELKRMVEHHVEEEEGEIFKIAKKILARDQANKLTLDMVNKKVKLMAVMEKE